VAIFMGRFYPPGCRGSSAAAAARWYDGGRTNELAAEVSHRVEPDAGHCRRRPAEGVEGAVAEMGLAVGGVDAHQSAFPAGSSSPSGV
jgi:hypothetical protein